jgi:alpha-amylase
VDILAGRVADYVGTLGLDRALMTVNLLDNHDVQRFVNEPGFGVSEPDIRRRYKLAISALMTLPGIPQIYYGNELGVYGGNDPDNRKDMPSWAWTDAGRNAPQSGYLGGSSGDNTPKATYDFVKRMIGVRKNNAALWKGYYAEMWRQNGGANVYAFYRGSGTNRFVVVFNNGTLSSGNIGIPISANTGINQTDRTALQNATFDDQAGYCATATITASNGTLNVNLPGQCVAVYKAR